MEWNHVLLTRPKKKRKWRKSFIKFMLIANNSIFKSIMSYFFSQVNSTEGVLPDDELRKNSFDSF